MLAKLIHVFLMGFGHVTIVTGHGMLVGENLAQLVVHELLGLLTICSSVVTGCWEGSLGCWLLSHLARLISIEEPLLRNAKNLWIVSLGLLANRRYHG